MSRPFNHRAREIAEKFSIPIREVRSMRLHKLECSGLALQILANEFHRSMAGGVKKLPKSQAALGMRSRVPGQWREFGS
jgi:hypothetical protein